MGKTKYEIRKAKNGEYYFILKVENGEIILNSEMYTTKQSCKKGIESVMKNAITFEIIDKTK